MSVTAKEPLLHAYLDGELDAAGVLELEAHLASCGDCAGELDRLRALRAMLLDALPQEPAPDRLRARILAALPPGDARPQPPRSAAGRSLLPRYLGSGALGALAAALLLTVAGPTVSGPTMADELVSDHVRSLQVAHLIDVQTSSRHVVRPWFNGKLDFTPPVVDLAPEGFPLAGGRLDYVRGRAVAALVYRRNLHVINLFVWPSGGSPHDLPSGRDEKDGYNLVHWTAGGLDFWAVSDAARPDLEAFGKAFAARSAS